MDRLKIPMVLKLLSSFTVLKMSYLKDKKSRNLMIPMSMRMEWSLSPIKDGKLM